MFVLFNRHSSEKFIFCPFHITATDCHPYHYRYPSCLTIYICERNNLSAIKPQNIFATSEIEIKIIDCILNRFRFEIFNKCNEQKES